jgi:MarR family transcriptional regulator, lower aerobic nicotinate degradation pathway regulator
VTGEDARLEIVDGLVQLSFVVQSVLANAASRHDLTVAQVRLLGILRDRQPGMMQLAQHLGLDKSSVTGLIDRAERRGLVTRGTSVSDGRAVRVSSTLLGRRLADQVGAEIGTAIDALTSGLNSTERNQLSAIASQILGAYVR